MKIIDAHLHIFPSEPGTDAMARGVGHENSVEHLRQVYGELEIVHGVVMGNRSLETGFHNYPRDLFHYCVGLDSHVLLEHLGQDRAVQLVEEGIGYAITIEGAVNENSSQSLCFRPFHPRLTNTSVLVWKKYQAVDAATAAFIEEAKMLVEHDKL